MDKILIRGFQIRKIEKTDNVSTKILIWDVMAEYDCLGEGSSGNDAEMEDLFTSYNAQRAEFFLIEKEGQILGCGGYAQLTGGNEDTCELRKMYFKAEIRGQGLGRAFLNLLMERAKASGYKEMYLETVERMKRANILYQKNGFIKLSSQSGATGHSACDSYYVKQL